MGIVVDLRIHMKHKVINNTLHIHKDQHNIVKRRRKLL